MMELKSILGELGTKINAPELIELSNDEKFPEFKIDDEVAENLKGKFTGLLTIEAAKNNPDIINSLKDTLKPQIKKSVLNNIDTSLLEVSRELYGDTITSEIAGIESTYDRITKFGEFAKEHLKKGSTDDKLKTTNEALKKQVDDLRKSFETELAQKDEKLNEVKTGYTQKLIDKQLDSELSNFELGEKYNEALFKKAIFDDIKTNVRKQAKLILTDDMEIGLRNPENDELELIIDNKKIESVKDILTPLIQPFVKKQTGKKITDNGADYTPAKKTEMSSLAQDIQKRKTQTNY